MKQNPFDLRLAIGITGTDFELTEEDYATLFEFDPPNVYELPQSFESFKKSCDQVRAKYPSMAIFKKIYQQYD